MKTVLFIVGTARSGSTLLNMVIGSHPQCFSLAEIVHLSDERGRNGLCGCGEILSQCSFWEKIRKRLSDTTGFDIFNVSEKQFPLGPGPVEGFPPKGKFFHYIESIFSLFHMKKSKKKWIDNAKILYDAVFEETGASVLVDSTKSISRAMLLRAHMENIPTKIIFLVRDGRAVVYSVQKDSPGVSAGDNQGKHRERCVASQPSAHRAIRNWRKRNLRILFRWGFIAKRDRLFMRYEDFCTAPEMRVKEIEEFLGIKPHGLPQSHRSVVQHGVCGNPKAKTGSYDILPAPQEWRSALSKDILRDFNKMAGFLNKYFGYD